MEGEGREGGKGAVGKGGVGEMCSQNMRMWEFGAVLKDLIVGL